MNKIYLIGDSTCQNNTRKTYPQHGWGQVFSAFISDDYQVINLAKNGRSSKSFFKEGLFKPCEENISNKDYLFIQFGHNDEKINDPNRYTEPFGEYQQNLKYFADSVKSKGGHIVYTTSITRHKFVDGVCINTHQDYPQAMLDFCKENKFSLPARKTFDFFLRT